MKLRKFSIIYLLVNILFLIPTVIDKMGIILLYGYSHFWLIYYFPALVYYVFFLHYIHIALFIFLTVFYIRASIKEKKASKLFYGAYTVLFAIAMFFNLYLAINGMTFLVV